ncbi:hypothetical protein RD792_016130 [Penstemon davidsonii]|uniref:MADS-box domain-containing protein n=1 Tax=Penstemon davidsonii TaxID=160366 RepID=A0ABR0CJ70_9LAMI|nr:hypothetical protein RD792_016130 [Penstemon davidsonii]
MSLSNQAPPKKSRGRQKVKMVKMENENNLQVTFSKRRAGLFKKASELCTLCGVEATIVVFSPGNKVYCFGHPNVETISNRFVTGILPKPTNSINQLIFDAHRDSTIRNLNLDLTQIESLLGMERKRGEGIDLIRKTGRMQKWFPTSIDEYNFEQLCVLKKTLSSLKKNFDVEVEKSMLRLGNSLPPLYPPPNKHENPNFSFGDFPTFNAPSSLGYSNDFLTYANISSGISNNDLYATGTGGINISSGISNNDLYPNGGVNISRNFGVTHAPYDHLNTNSIDLVSHDFHKANGFQGSYDPTSTLPNNVVDPYGLMTGGSGSAMYFVGGTNFCSSMHPIDQPQVVSKEGSTHFRGLNNDCGSGLF